MAVDPNAALSVSQTSRKIALAMNATSKISCASAMGPKMITHTYRQVHQDYTHS